MIIVDRVLQCWCNYNFLTAWRATLIFWLNLHVDRWTSLSYGWPTNITCILLRCRVGSLTMYSEWASLQDEIQCDKANQSVLHKFPTPVGTTVATSVVRHIAVSLSITANSQEPCQLDSDKEVKWAMEVSWISSLNGNQFRFISMTSNESDDSLSISFLNRLEYL